MGSSPRSTVSILRTVLHLLNDDPALRDGSETFLEFRQVAEKLITEIESEHSITNGIHLAPSIPIPDTPFKK